MTYDLSFNVCKIVSRISRQKFLHFIYFLIFKCVTVYATVN